MPRLSLEFVDYFPPKIYTSNLFKTWLFFETFEKKKPKKPQDLGGEGLGFSMLGICRWFTHQSRGLWYLHGYQSRRLQGVNAWLVGYRCFWFFFEKKQPTPQPPWFYFFIFLWQKKRFVFFLVGKWGRDICIYIYRYTPWRTSGKNSGKKSFIMHIYIYVYSFIHIYIYIRQVNYIPSPSPELFFHKRWISRSYFILFHHQIRMWNHLLSTTYVPGLSLNPHCEICQAVIHFSILRCEWIRRKQCFLYVLYFLWSKIKRCLWCDLFLHFIWCFWSLG